MLAVLLGPLILVGLSHPPAGAADCNTQIKQFFVRASTNDVTAGTKNKILLKDRYLDPNCVNPIALSTAHIHRGYVCCDGYWVEIGWWEDQGSGGHQHRVFVEKGADYTVTQIDKIVAPNLVSDTYDLWRLKNNARNANGTTDWNLQVDFLKGEGWVDVVTYNTAWHKGYAYGETEAKGSATGMADDQQALEYRAESSSSWTSWPGQVCTVQQGPVDYSYSKVSNSAYKIIASGAGC